MSQGPITTRRVRILVVIDPTGHWEASGSASYTDAETRSNLDDFTGDMGRPPWGYHWIEANVPVPAAEPDTAIEGEVTDAQP